MKGKDTKIKVDINDSNTYVECPECKEKLTRIVHWHIKKHGYTVEEFEKKYNITSRDRICNAVRNRLGFTKNKAIAKYGTKEGLKRWESYCKAQAVTNTFEYKQQKYGWTKDQFSEYNKSRASTKTNFIKRYGKNEGNKRWTEYCELQKYVGVKLEYFIKKYGKTLGHEKYNQMCFLKSNTKESFIYKYGESEGMLRWDEYLQNKYNGYSKIANSCFSKITENLDDERKKSVYWAEHNTEYFFSTSEYIYYVDFYDKSTNTVIEFFGDYWHCNPKIYPPDFFHPTIKKTAKEIQLKDKNRIEQLKRDFNINIYIIWENDYNTTQESVLKDCKKILIYEK